jgi:hypothetical protein
MSNQPKTENNLKFLDIASKFILIYLSLKLVIFPVVQTGINIIPNLASREKISIESIKIPDLTFSDVTLLLIIFLFQPQTSKIFETLDISAQGLKAQFRKLEDKVDQAQADLDKLQQKQIDELNQLQRFMYPLLLTPLEIEKLKGLKENSEKPTPSVCLQPAVTLAKTLPHGSATTKPAKWTFSKNSDSKPPTTTQKTSSKQ